ncbi:MAG: SpoIIE family protein phosphatase [Candidatus Eiseniibacteriota bacterium]|nr:MAG: SpoIIE family protein phosphatase [Candidatus Eisenbacteria bacterium]
MVAPALLSTVFFLLGALIFLLGMIIFREAPRQRVNLAVSMMLFSAGFGAVLGASGLVAESQSLDSRAYGYFVRTFAYLWEFFFPFLFLFALLYPRERRILSRVPGLELLIFVPHAFHFIFVLITAQTGGEFEVATAAERIPYSRSILELGALFLRLVYRWHLSLFSFVNLAFAASSVVLLWQGYWRGKSPALRQQMLVVFLGIGTCVGLYGVAVLIPQAFGRTVPLGLRSSLMVLSLTIGSAAIAYSVVRYKFLDTRLIARRSVLYGVVSVIFIGAYLTVIKQLDRAFQGFTGTETAVFETVFLVLALIMFQPVIGRLEAYLEEFLMRHRTDYRNVLRSLSRDIVTVLDINELSGRLLGSLRESLVATSGTLAVVDKDTQMLRLVDSFGIDAVKIRQERPAAILGDVATHVTLLSRKEALSMIPDRTQRESMQEFLTAASAEWLLPLMHQEEILGALTLGRKVLPTRFHSEDRQLLESLGSQLSLAVKNSFLYKETLGKKLMEEELLFARKIQSSFLPREFPSFEKLDLYGKNVPSRFVGGDYFDVIPLGNGRFLMAIGDVSGKGVPAALLMSMLQASLRTQSMDPKPLDHAVRTLNSLVVDMTAPEQFATFFLGMIDVASMTFTYCNAGHCYPILGGAGVGSSVLSEGDLVLGVLKDASFSEHRVKLSEGHLLVLYTDGVTEASGSDREEYGEKRLRALVDSLPPSLGAREVVQTVEKAVLEFSNSSELSDDMTVLALRVLSS